MTSLIPPTPMRALSLEQGSDSWKEHRFATRNASEAGCMLGCDPKRSRSDLMAAVQRGWQEAASTFVEEVVFAGGHRCEELARPLAEQIVGEDLLRIVGERDWPGLPVPLGASFDGLTIARDKGWEHKQMSQELRDAMPKELLDGDGFMPSSEAHRLPKRHRAQMTQQSMVSGTQAILFTASEWSADGKLIDARHCWYIPEPDLVREIVAGWAQFEVDLAEFTPVVHAAKPVANKPDSFPVPVLIVEGRIVSTTIGEWRDLAIAHIDSINTDLQTDQDFADAKSAVSWSEDSEKMLKRLKDAAVAQMGSINDVFKAVDEIIALMRTKRLTLASKITTRENEIRSEIADSGRKKLQDHIAALNRRIGNNYMPAANAPGIRADFDKAIKGKRTVKGLHDAVEAELTRCKIDASAIADNIEINLRYLREYAAGEFKGLFSDVATIVLKQHDDLQALVTARISEHKAAIERRAEAERERIRNEEQERAEREAREKLAAEARAREEVAARERQEREARDALDRQQREASAAPAQQPSTPAVAQPRPQAAPAPSTVVQMRPAAPPADDGARMKLGEINTRIAPLAVTADGLADLGFKHVATEKAAKLYRAADFPLIVDALIARLNAARDTAPMAA